MDSPYERTVVTTKREPPSGLRARIDAFANRFTKSVETRNRNPAFGIRNAGIDRIKPPEDLNEHRAIAENTPIVRKSLTDYVSDVVGPGYRIETDNETVAEYLEEVWATQCAIIAGEKHNDLLPFLRLFVFEKWRGGDGLASHVRADSENIDSPITGLHLLNPAHVEFVTYEDKDILVDPDPVEETDARETARGEAAAYVQYGDKALIPLDREAVPLSQNDVTRSALDPGAGNVRGTPITETIDDDVTGFKNILRDKEQAIKTKAYGLWMLGFGRDTVEYTDVDPETGEETEVTEIIEWSEDEQENFVDEHLSDIEPGGIIAHDGLINPQRVDSDVPDLIDDLHFYVSNIISALPTPLYVVGFETDINQFVTERQDERYQNLIEEEREELERVFSDLMRRVVRNNLVENSHEHDGTTYSVNEVPSDLKFKVEPAEAESPVKSLDTETIEKMGEFMQALDRGLGDTPVDMVLDMPAFLQLTMDLPEDVFLDSGMTPGADDDFDIDEADEEVREQFNRLRDLMDGDADGSPFDDSNAANGGGDGVGGENSPLQPPDMDDD